MGEITRTTNSIGPYLQVKMTTILQSISCDISSTVPTMDSYSYGKKLFNINAIL